MFNGNGAAEKKRTRIKFKILIRRFKYCIYFSTFAICLVVCCFIAVKKEISMFNIAISILSGISASCLLSIIVSMCFSELEKRQDILDDWGLCKICEDRIVDLLSNKLPKRTLDILVFGLSPFSGYSLDEIVRKVSNGLHIRIIALHPCSVYVKRLQHSENYGCNLENEMTALIDFVNEIKDRLSKQKSDGKIEIKLYNNLPPLYYCCADDSVYVELCTPSKVNNGSITYEFNAYLDGGKYYSTLFDKIWNSKFDEGFLQITEEAVIPRGKISSGIKELLKFYSKLINSKENSVVGIVVIFKGDLRRTFYSYNKRSEETHKCYSRNDGAFDEFFVMNQDATDRCYNNMLKDYSHEICFKQSIQDRHCPIINKLNYRDDASPMRSTIPVDAVLLAPIFKEDKIIGALTFDFADFPANYDSDTLKNQTEFDSASVLMKWFNLANSCAQIVGQIIGTQEDSEFEQLFYSEWHT